MTAVRLHPLAAVLVVLLSGIAAGPGRVGAEVTLLAEQGWILGPTSIPDPTVGDYLGQVEARYLQPPAPWFDGQPSYPGYSFTGLVTPEQFCPFVCLPPPNPQLTFGASIDQGVDLLRAAVLPQLQAGDQVTVFGYSQSATISTQLMAELVDNPPGGGYHPDNLHFVLVGDPNNPFGGILTRFQFPDGVQPFSLAPAPQHVPFVNIPLSIGPTPTGAFTTDIYTGEYDGLANLPQDPTNLLALVNALIGIPIVHLNYLEFDNLADTVSPGSIGDTTFYFVPQQLPVLWPLYQLGDVGKVIGDALTPGLKLVIDWGYGNPGDPVAALAGPWAVTATGQLSDGSGVFGLLPMMDPLQLLAGIQYAAVQTLVDPINDILGLTGQAPLPDSLVDTLLTGYRLTNELDAALLTGWDELAASHHLPGPDAVFDGEPLLSLQPLFDLGGVTLSMINFFGA